MYIRERGKASIYSEDAKPHDDLKCEIHIQFKEGGFNPTLSKMFGYLTFKDGFDLDDVLGSEYWLTFKSVKIEIMIKAASARTCVGEESQVYFEAA